MSESWTCNSDLWNFHVFLVSWLRKIDNVNASWPIQYCILTCYIKRDPTKCVFLYRNLLEAEDYYVNGGVTDGTDDFEFHLILRSNGAELN